MKIRDKSRRWDGTWERMREERYNQEYECDFGPSDYDGLMFLAQNLLIQFNPHGLTAMDIDLKIHHGVIDVYWGDILYRQYSKQTSAITGFFEEKPLGISPGTCGQMNRLIQMVKDR